MATAADIALVRRYTDEPTTVTYPDELIGGYVDELGAEGASARIWREKAAYYAKLVNTSEGTARRDLSDLHKNAMSLAGQYDLIAEVPGAVLAPRVRKIVRS